MPQSRHRAPTRHAYSQAFLLNHSLSFDQFTLASGDDILTSGASTPLAIEALRKEGYHIESRVGRRGKSCQGGIKLHPFLFF